MNKIEDSGGQDKTVNLAVSTASILEILCYHLMTRKG